MRGPMTLQVVLGLSALFGFAYFSVDKFVTPASRLQLERAAQAEAHSTAGDVKLEWQEVLAAQRTVVIAAVKGPIIGTLGDVVDGSAKSGGEVSEVARRNALRSALESVADQVGYRGRAVLVAKDRSVISASVDEAKSLADMPVLSDALDGAAAVRFSRFPEGGVGLVAAAPVEGTAGEVIGGLLIATPIDAVRLKTWTRYQGLGGAAAIASNGQLLITTLSNKRAAMIPKGDLGAYVEVDGVQFSVVGRDLTDDSGVVARAMGLVPIDSRAITMVTENVELFVGALGVLAVLLFLSVTLVNPALERGELPRASHPAPAADPRLAPPPVIHPRDVHAPVAHARVAHAPVAHAPPVAAPAETPPPRRLVIGETEPMFRPLVSYAPGAAASPLVSSGPAGVSGGAASSMLAAPSSAAFEAIAAAALSAPLPLSDAEHDSGWDAVALRDPDSDLPMPVGHRDLPSPRGSATSPPQNGGRGTGSLPIPSLAPTASQVPSDSPAPRDPEVVNLPGSRAPSQAPSHAQALSQAAGLTQQGSGVWSLGSSFPDEGPTQSSRPIDPTQSESPASANPAPRLASFVQPSRFPFGADPVTWHGPRPEANQTMAFDEEHYRVVYNDFVGTKARLGEVVDNITFEGFSSKLRSSEKALIDRHGCKAVRFQVLVKDRQVSLRPQLVR